MAVIAADLTAVGFNLFEFQTAAGKDTGIGVVFVLLALMEPFFVDVE